MEYNDEYDDEFYEEKVYDLIDEAASMLSSKLAIPILEEAVKIADANNDIILGIEVRYKLSKKCVFSGESMKAIINFSWCVLQIDKLGVDFFNPSLIYDLLWQYKWIVENIINFSAIPLAKINELLDDMKKRYIENNRSLEAYYSLKVSLATRGVNDGTDIKEDYANWLSTPKDSSSDCTACVIHRHIEYYIYIKDYEKALKETKKLLSNGYSCAEVPHMTYGAMLIPLLKMNKPDIAEEFHKKGYPKVTGDKSFIITISEHIIYLSLTDIDKGLAAFTKNYPIFLESNVDRANLWAYLCGYILFSKILASDTQTVKMRIPKTSPIYAHGTYDVAKLIEYFKDETMKLKDAFDKRNGNNVLGEEIDDIIKFCGI